MCKSVRVALLCVAIGFLLGYIGLSIHDIRAEASAIPQVQVQAKPAPFQNPDIYIGGKPDIYIGSEKPSPRRPRAARPVPPPPIECGVGDFEPCRLREVKLI